MTRVGLLVTIRCCVLAFIGGHKWTELEDIWLDEDQDSKVEDYST